MAWQKLPKPFTLWEEGEKWFELEDNLTEGKFDFLEYKEEPLPRGIILQRDVSVAMGPEILGTPGDLSRIWVAFTDQETGEIYLARSDADWNQWEEYLHIIYAPSGSYQPSLTFGQDGWHRMAVTLVPAGTTQEEIWIYEPPYSGYGVRKIADGQHPLIAKNFYGDTYLFYSKDEILYRAKKDNYSEELNLLLPYEGDKPLGFRTIIDRQSFNFCVFKHIIFVGNGVSLPNYVLTNKTLLAMEQLSTKASVKSIDWVDWSFNVSFLVKDTFTQQPLEGALVTFKGIERVTNSAGIADFGRLGVLDEEDFTVNAEGYNEAGWTLEITEDTMVEVMLLGPMNLNESLSASAQVLGISWEEVLDPAVMVRVYSSYEDVPTGEQTHLLKHTNNSSNQRESLVWQSKGQSADQDATVNIYTSGSKRPGIALRVSGSSGSESFYDGIFRFPNNYLEIGRYVGGSFTSLGTKTMDIEQNKWYSLRMQAIGTSVKLKIWERGLEEPLDWDLEITDSSLTSGYAGVFDFDSNGMSMWQDFYLNDEKANWETSDGGIPDGWSLQFGTVSRWSTETIEELERVYTPVPNASITFGEQSALSDSEGLARFEDIPYDTMQPFEITHPDYQGITKGEVFVPELDGEEDFWVNVKIQDLPIEPYKESLSTSVQVTGIDWEDMTYVVTFVVRDYQTNTLMSGVQVDFNNEVKTTDGSGQAVFVGVRPFPTVVLYDYTLTHADYDEPTLGQVRVSGNDQGKAIIIGCQIGLKTLPRKTDGEHLQAQIGFASILWVEVEE